MNIVVRKMDDFGQEVDRIEFPLEGLSQAIVVASGKPDEAILRVEGMVPGDHDDTTEGEWVYTQFEFPIGDRGLAYLQHDATEALSRAVARLFGELDQLRREAQQHGPGSGSVAAAPGEGPQASTALSDRSPRE